MKVIHKRRMDSRKNQDRTWQLCDESIKFSGSEYVYSNPEFSAWIQIAKFQWKHVTCEKCLEMKNEK